MVTARDLKAYGFGELSDYFTYISDSHTNGQIKQVKNLIAEMSAKQRSQFRVWCNENDCSHLLDY